MAMVRKKQVADTGDSYPLEKHWHISRGIPLGLILSMLVGFALQSGTVIWFFAHQDSRIDAVEKVQTTATQIGEKLQAATAAQNIETAKLGEKVVAVQASVNRIEALLTSAKPR
jgi:hypothetical protein